MTTSKNQKYLKRAFFDKVERANSYAYKSQVFVGEPSDFIVIIKDSIHKNDGKQPTPTAGKYICYGKGQIFDDFIKNGIVYKEGSFFVSEDVAPKSEKKTLPRKKREEESERVNDRRVFEKRKNNNGKYGAKKVATPGVVLTETESDSDSPRKTKSKKRDQPPHPHLLHHHPSKTTREERETKNRETKCLINNKKCQ